MVVDEPIEDEKMGETIGSDESVAEEDQLEDAYTSQQVMEIIGCPKGSLSWHIKNGGIERVGRNKYPGATVRAYVERLKGSSQEPEEDVADLQEVGKQEIEETIVTENQPDISIQQEKPNRIKYCVESPGRRAEVAEECIGEYIGNLLKGGAPVGRIRVSGYNGASTRTVRIGYVMRFSYMNTEAPETTKAQAAAIK